MPSAYGRNAALLGQMAREKNLPCYRCGLEFDWHAPVRTRWRFSADHILPKSRGGSDELSNLLPAHIGCNSARGNGTTRGLGSHNGIRRHENAPDARSPHSERWP